jgi:hypothetical protein
MATIREFRLQASPGAPLASLTFWVLLLVLTFVPMSAAHWLTAGGPAHLYEALRLGELIAGEGSGAELYDAEWRGLGGALVPFVLILLQKIASADVALKLAGSLAIFAGGINLRLLNKTVTGMTSWPAVAGLFVLMNAGMGAGNLPLIWGLALAPSALASLYHAIRPTAHANWITLGINLSVLWMAHPPLFILTLVAVLTTAGLWRREEIGEPDLRRRLFYTLAAAGPGLLGLVFYLMAGCGCTPGMRDSAALRLDRLAAGVYLQGPGNWVVILVGLWLLLMALGLMRLPALVRFRSAQWRTPMLMLVTGLGLLATLPARVLPETRLDLVVSLFVYLVLLWLAMHVRLQGVPRLGMAAAIIYLAFTAPPSYTTQVREPARLARAAWQTADGLTGERPVLVLNHSGDRQHAGLGAYLGARKGVAVWPRPVIPERRKPLLASRTDDLDRWVRRFRLREEPGNFRAQMLRHIRRAALRPAHIIVLGTPGGEISGLGEPTFQTHNRLGKLYRINWASIGRP